MTFLESLGFFFFFFYKMRIEALIEGGKQV